MNNKIKSEKYRKLSIAALVAGILADSLAILYLLIWSPLTNFLQNFIDETTPVYNIGLFVPVIISLFVLGVLGLSITAVVCGSIDLKRIKAGRYSNKGRGFDIAGIVLGGIFILALLVVLLFFYRLKVKK